MGAKQRDCVVCAAPVGVIGRDHCCVCTAKIRLAAARSTCPDCGRSRVLVADTGRCARCSRRCQRCERLVRSAKTLLCKTCRRLERQEAARQPCPRCGRPGFIREATGWCGLCSRPVRPSLPPRECRECGQTREHEGLGLCTTCIQRRPERPFIRAANIASRLNDPPAWLDDFTTYVAATYSPGYACTRLTELGHLLEEKGSRHPQALLDRCRGPERSATSLTRMLEEFFTARGLALPADHAGQRAAEGRRRSIQAVDPVLRDGVASFCQFVLTANDRARRAGTRPRDDKTIHIALTTIRDFAGFLIAQRGKTDWALAAVDDVEAFLATNPDPNARSRRLAVLRQFFRHARTTKMILIDPTRGLRARTPHRFIGRTLTLDQQRVLFRRWIDEPDVHPHEALVGIFALLHGASSRELKLLTVDDIHPQNQAVSLGNRPHPTVLDPFSWQVLQRCLEHRAALRTTNPHVLVTRGSKATRAPASTSYMTRVLDGCGFSPQTIRCTRLLEMVNSMDPKLVAAAFGLTPSATMNYLADRVDPGRIDQFGEGR